MNIFTTSDCPIEAAYNLCHRHVVKMITEGFQLLSTAHRLLDGNEHADNYNLFKATHTGNRCTLWVMESSENYNWLLLHTEAMCEIYTKSTGRPHGSMLRCLEGVSKLPNNIRIGETTPFARCMDKDPEASSYANTIEGYKVLIRNKYNEWRCRDKPLSVVYPLNNQPEWV